MVTGLSGVNIVHVFTLGQGVWCHIWGAPLESVLETLRLRSGRTEFASLGDGFRHSAAGMTWEKGVEGSRLGGGCAISERTCSCLRSHDGGWGCLAMQGPPLDPWRLLRMSGPFYGWLPTGQEPDLMEGTVLPRFLAEPRNDRVKRGRRGGEMDSRLGGRRNCRGLGVDSGSGTRDTLGMPCDKIGRHPDATIVLIVEYAQEIANTGEQDAQSGLTL